MPDSAPLHLRFDAFELDERQARLTRQGVPLAAQPKVFGLLCALARRPGELLSKDELLDAAWGHQFVSESVLKSAISDLRTLLGDDVKQPRFIETVPRRGYRFIAEVMVGPAAGSAAGLPPLIGRAAAQHQLQALWSEALGGRRRMAWLVGEAGIGKTSLIEHFMAGLGGDPIVAHGHCIEQYGAGEPYMPVLEALAGLCRGDAGLPALLRQVAPTWLLQMPWLASEAELAALRAQLAGAVGHRGPALERPGQPAPDGSHGASAHAGAADVAGELQARRNPGGGSSPPGAQA
jgi:DNA-binding winged helix-turn-helix (wHTH) protein